MRERQHDETDDRSGQAEDQDWTPSVLVRPVAEHRRRKQLAKREDREERTNRERRRAKGFRVERQQRNDDAEADVIDENREKDDEQRPRHDGRFILYRHRATS